MSNDLRTVKVSDIRANPVSLRPVDREDDGWVQFVDSIKSKGVLNPISLREKYDPDGTVYYEICDGLHRYSGACDAGLEEVNAVIVGFNDAEVLEAQLTANLHKFETKPVQYTEQLKRILNFNPTMTISEMAERVHQSPAWLNQRLGLLKLDTEIQKLVDEGRISLPNAYALSTLPKDEQLNYIDSAMTMNTSEFGPTIKKRKAELSKATREGRESAPQVFEPVAVARKLSEIKEELANGSAGPAIVAASGAKTAAEGFAEAVKWFLTLDATGVAAQKAKYDARIKQQNEAKAKKEAERADKKAKEAAEAQAKAKEAAAAV